MNDWVVDSSVVAKWVLAESDSAHALRVVTDAAARGEQLHVIDFAMIEVANVIWTRHHRGLLTLTESQQAMTLLRRAAVSVRPSLPLLDSAFDISLRFDIAVYDALFVAAARGQRCHGVTADEPLVRAVPEIKLLKNW